MHEEQPSAHDAAERAPQTVAPEPVDDVSHGAIDEPVDDLADEAIDERDREEWLDRPDEADELPPRPRRRLLTPIPLALLAVLLIAGGFIGGVQVQKGEESSASAGGGTASRASRFAGLRGAPATGAGAGAGKTATGGGAGGGFPGAGAGGSRPTTGTVAYLAGNTIYVTNPEGNTVKVTTSAATSVTKSVKTKVNGIHPGEIVTVTGATSGGTVSAESVSVGSSGGLAGLFGGSAAKGGRGGSAGSAGSAAPQLFGSG
ncbi:MAG TPA: hypothetical protein VG010_11450 [Solirubrobacteraceae bacterium]|jgi:hypothetical protein|nr:hypothetical protein [Solirubrobacteraceae bacterium]